MAGHPIFARMYGRLAPLGEQAGSAAHRDELLHAVSGRVIEIGAGSGLCFDHYPSTVTEVIAVEPEPYLRGLAEQAATRAPVPVQVIAASAERLPVDDTAFDVAVACLVLCSVPDPQAALAELHRVLRPGGEIRFYEHVRSRHASQARLQDRVDWFWPRLLGGCHANRDTTTAITAAGFAIQSCRQFGFRLSLFDAPASPHVIGTAIRQ